MKIVTLAATGLVLLSGCMNTAATDTALTPNPVVVTAADFDIVAGPGWTGTLSYLDYSSNERASIPVAVSFDTPKTRSMSYAIKYPGEAQYNARETIKLSRDGMRLNGASIIERTQNADDSVQIVTQKTGKDDGRRAVIQTRYILTPRAFKIRKDVKPEGEMAFLNRNEFSLTR